MTKEYEIALTLATLKLESTGYRVVVTNKKNPDAVAAKSNRIFAVKLLRQTWRKGKGWQRGHTKKEMKEKYSNYDGVLFFSFRSAKKDDENGEETIRHERFK